MPASSSTVKEGFNSIHEGKNHQTSSEKSGQVARISMSAETAFDGIALAKLGELLTTEAGYEQVITFLFGSGEEALAINEALETAAQRSRR